MSMRYLIGVKDSYHPCGNSGTLGTRYKAPHKLREVAQRFAKMYGHDEVYLLDHYPQRLCELCNAAFVDYVRHNCKRYV